MHLLRIGLFSLLVMAASSPVDGAIRDDIKEKTAELETAAELLAAGADTRNVPQAQQVALLNAAIRRGRQASDSLTAEIGKLETQKNELEEKKRSLERVQVVLTSGLIGAVVTALVAVLGLFFNMRQSRSQRELQRLEVVEKAFQMVKGGIPLPDDIQRGLPSTARND